MSRLSNQDIKSELSSIASSTTEGIDAQRDNQIKNGLTYREAASYIMASLNDVLKRLGLNQLVEPVLENATKAVQQELNKQHGKSHRVDDYVLEYSKMVVDKFKNNEEEYGVECPQISYNTTLFAKLMKEEELKSRPKESTPIDLMISR